MRKRRRPIAAAVPTPQGAGAPSRRCATCRRFIDKQRIFAFRCIRFVGLGAKAVHR
ncbi:hypothetical protein C4K37_4283 [Pseudomonas chlororaphis subsp. piscium]|nr:hypothetical protein C4K37_4283 [Pseudomonas chlororaphis subsp. piscium]AZC45212.1 hypothetical protein C4K36_4295 [Pseudomonas chlororaphis subsp. piscium]